ncbi:MAG: hypothetical protein L3J21_02780 [Devosiaceae bacterium]|nr:hypothetical protein [Devosiaceae bacterium]
MAIEKLAIELEETIHQTKDLVDSINVALEVLLDKSIENSKARQDAAIKILIGLQAQDRIEQRCANIKSAIEQIRHRTAHFDEDKAAFVWQNLTLDELSKPEMSCTAAKIPSGDCDLF